MPGSRVLWWLSIATLVAAMESSAAAQAPRNPPSPRAVPLVAAADGTARGAIAGRVVAAEDGRPIRRAQIRAEQSPARSEPRTVLTDDDGRYQLSGLFSGTWTITVSKAGYVRFVSSEKASTGSASPRVVNDRLTSFDAALVRGGAITGAVFDEFGDPIAGAAVQALRARLVEGERRLTVVAMDQTDDTGAFRLHSLPAGEYYVSMRVRESRPEEPGPPSEGLATFYPGTPNVGEARRVSIRPGDERGGVNFTLLITRGGRISGTVIDSMGRPVNEAPVELVDPADGRIVGHPFGNFGLTHDGGRFTFLNVSPGSYLLSAVVDSPTTSYEERALVPVIASEGSSEVTVTADPGTSITGTIATTSASLPRAWRAQIWARSGYGVTPPHRATLTANEPFTLAGVSGPTSFGVADLPAGWTLQRIEINGVDVTDGTVDIRPRTPVTARVVVTNAIAPLTGIVTINGTPAADVTVAAFVTEPTKWTVPSRFVKLTRTDAQGRFRVAGLPAADYLVVASREFDDDEYLDAELLLRLRSRAVPISITERSPASVTLTLDGAR